MKDSGTRLLLMSDILGQSRCTLVDVDESLQVGQLHHQEQRLLEWIAVSNSEYVLPSSRVTIISCIEAP